MHLLALAGRGRRRSFAGRLGQGSAAMCRPSLTCQPSGKYLMEEFYYAGGLPVVIKAVAEMGLLHNDAITVSGDTIWNDVKAVVNYNEDVICRGKRR